jgi:hypothetical protein
MLRLSEPAQTEDIDFRSLVKKMHGNGAMSVPIDTSLSPVSAIIAMTEARKGGHLT